MQQKLSMMDISYLMLAFMLSKASLKLAALPLLVLVQHELPGLASTQLLAVSVLLELSLMLSPFPLTSSS